MSVINDALKFFGPLNKYEITVKVNLREEEFNQPISSLEDIEKELDRQVKNKEIGLSVKNLHGVQYYVHRPQKG